MQTNLRGVYLIKSNDHYKIGITDNGIEKRISQLQTGNPNTIKAIAFKKVNDRNILEALERALHKKFAHCRVSGEWFILDDTDLHTLLRIYNNSNECTSGLDIQTLTGIYTEPTVKPPERLPLIAKSIMTSKGVLIIMIPDYGDDTISIHKASKLIKKVRANLVL